MRATMKTLHHPPIRSLSSVSPRNQGSAPWSAGIIASCLALLMMAACSDIVPDAAKFAPGFGGPDSGGEADAADAGSADSGSADTGTTDAVPSDTTSGDAGAKECTTAADCEKTKGAAPKCQEHACSQAGVCSFIKVADKKPCNDGDACSGEDHCVDGSCKGTPGSKCDDNNACTTDTCDPKTGSCDNDTKLDGPKHKCDDGDSCTTGDVCKNGVCAPGTDTCVCKIDADCAGKSKATKCLGTLYCDKTVKDHQCQVNPATVAFCSTLKDTICKKNACDKVTGSCAKVPWYQATVQCEKLAPGLNCIGEKDGDQCCFVGVDLTKKFPTKAHPCTDGDSCTVTSCKADGSCVPQTNLCSCSTIADCAKKEDGDPCNGTLYCDITQAKPTCVVNPASVVKCADVDNTVCKQNVCDKQDGTCKWVITKTKFKACTDNNPCTVGDTCNNTSGACDPGTDTCTCKADSDCASFDDGDPCNGTFFCDKSGKQPACKVNPKTIVVCSVADDDSCKANRCDKKTGKCAFDHSDKFTTCNADGNPCTSGDYCDGKGKCIVGTHICTCEKDADCAKSDDGDACNGTLQCDTKVVPPRCVINDKTIVKCDGTNDTTCAKNVCNKKTGKCGTVNASSNVLCSDGEPCTVGDSCDAGKCAPGTDTCVCKEDADCKDDANPCNGVDFCDKAAGKCKANPKTVVTCDTSKDKGCAKNTCDLKTGKCALAGDGSCAKKSACAFNACDTATGSCKETGKFADGTACGSGGACVAGACKPAVAGMVLVAGGEAYIGCNKELDAKCAANADENGQAKIQLSPFYMDVFEVTVAEFDACVTAGKCKKPAATGAKCNHGKTNRGNHPINCVTFAEAQGYCAAQGKNLPTEAQWEAAARGVCSHWGVDCAKKVATWPWGEVAANCAMAIVKDGGKEGCGADSTHPVGARPKDESPHGVRDMGGSVSEWTLDWYDKSAYGGFAGKTDPQHTTKSAARVIRGGNLKESADRARAGNREAHDPASSDYTIGFRCANIAK